MTSGSEPETPILWLLRIFGPISLSRLCERAGRPMAQTHHLLAALQNNGYASWDEASRSYDITEKGRGRVEAEMEEARAGGGGAKGNGMSPANIAQQKSLDSAATARCVGVARAEGERKGHAS